MFKLIFKILSVIVIIIVIILGLIVWKGGEPFKWAGEKTVQLGKSIEQFGNIVDGLIDNIKKGRKQASDKIIKIKKDLSSEKENKKETEDNKEDQ